MTIQILVGLALMILGILSALLIAFEVLSVKAKNKALFICYILTCVGLFIIIGYAYFTQIGIVS